MANENVDVAVVGGGLMGSSAARHLAEAGQSVVVIAAPEPSDWSAGVGPFASHYDAGRITRVIAGDSVWSELAVRSIQRYDDIAERSGIDFHDPRGIAWLGIDTEEAVANSKQRGADARFVTPEWLFATTGIRMPDTPGMRCAYEGAPAGLVNPRRLAAAQLKLAELAGATVIASAATSVTPAPTSVTVSGDFGDVTADRILLATGAYSADLVGVDLGVQRLLRTTLLIEMGPAPEMPSLIMDPVDNPHINDVYWVPPVRFPDGRTLFKIGCEIENAPQVETAAEINAWFATSGDQLEADALMETTRQLLPTASMHSWHNVPCVITRTESTYPSIGWVDDRVAVAIGGNGASAKSCDEIGRLASTLFAPDGWTDPELDAALFAPRPR